MRLPETAAKVAKTPCYVLGISMLQKEKKEKNVVPPPPPEKTGVILHPKELSPITATSQGKVAGKYETQSCSESCVFPFSNPILIIMIIIITLFTLYLDDHLFR